MNVNNLKPQNRKSGYKSPAIKKGWLAKNWKKAIKTVLFIGSIPALLSIPQCAVKQPSKDPTDWENLKFVYNRSIENYRIFLGKGPVVPDYKPTPHVLICTPTDHAVKYMAGDQEAAEYDRYVKMQIARRVLSLNDPDSYERVRNPGMDFTLVVHKKDNSFTPQKAERGFIALTTLIPYHHTRIPQERRCPPESLKNPAHSKHRPEFANTSYTAHWEKVPTLGR
jgi:hypothetical protein